MVLTTRQARLVAQVGQVGRLAEALSTRAIAAELGLNKDTVTKYLRLARLQRVGGLLPHDILEAARGADRRVRNGRGW